MWKQLWVSLSACSFTASTTRESVCPTFITPMPPPKSMNVLPSTSVRRAPFASLANIGVAIPTPEETALCRRSIKARLFGPGISVLILVDSSIVATSSCRANSFQYTLRRLPSDTPERDSRARCLHRPRFLGEREQAEKLVRHVGGEEGRDLGVVVGGIDLNHVATDDLKAGETPHELLRLAACEAPDLRRPRPRGVCGVDEVHVEGDADLRVGGPPADTINHARYTELADLVCRDEVEAHLARLIPIAPVVDRTPHPDLDGTRGIEVSLFDSPPERRAVRVLLAEVGVPGVGMGVELHEGQRSMDRSGSPELRQRYGVVAAEDYRDDAGPVDRVEALLYPPVTLLDVAWDDGYVAVVYDREEVEDSHVHARVVAPEEVRGAAYPVWTEAGPGPEGGARVERRAHYRGVCVLQVPRVRQAHEGAHAREARRLEGVSRFVPSQAVSPHFEYHDPASDSLLVSDSLITSEGSLCGGPNALRSA